MIPWSNRRRFLLLATGLAARWGGTGVLAQSPEDEALAAYLGADIDYFAAAPPAAPAFVRAVKTVGELRLEEALPLLRSVAGDPAEAEGRRQAASAMALSVCLSLGRYADAVEAGGPSAEADSSASGLEFAKALLGAPPPSADVRTASVAGRRDMAGLFRARGSVGASEVELVLDTGADFSVVTRSLAEAARLKILPGSVGVRGSGGKTNQASLALGQIRLGSSVFQNAVLIVLPDEALRFPAGYRIDAILGFPQLRNFGALTFTRTAVQLKAAGARAVERPTLWARELNLFSRVEVLGQPLWFHLDTGARRSALSMAGAERLGANLPTGARRDVVLHGAGGGQTTSQVQFPAEVAVGGRKVKLERFTLRDGEPQPRGHGVIGQDLLSKGAGFELDLDRMQLSLLA